MPETSGEGSAARARNTEGADKGDEQGCDEDGQEDNHKVRRIEAYGIIVDGHQGGIGGGELYPAEMLLAESQQCTQQESRGAAYYCDEPSQ